ncbi:MAG: ABC transporter permease [Pyrinomonadaceae bacterium MAG19_C2-C3]|nr:ABC transporter permease [Pyrinomonadaceae bacterium MAG19_C2-C3]
MQTRNITDLQSANALTTARRMTVIHPPSFSPFIVFTGLARLRQHLDLLWTLIVHRLKVRYKQSVLGPAWAVVQPLFLMLIYTVIFARIARVETGGIPYPIFAYTALLPWTAFSSALTAATGGVTSHADLVKKVYFPREILPLSYIAAALVDLMIASIVLWGLFLYYGVQLTVFALWGLPIILIMITFAAAVSLLLSALQVRFRDIGMAMPLLLQLWMFATPVVYPLSAVPEQWRVFYTLNPMVGVIENFRRVMLEGIAPDYVSLGIATMVSLVLLPLAYMYFKHLEATMADVI